MKEHYVSYECAQALKRFGFEEEVSHYYIHFKSDGEVKLWSTNPPDNHNARLSINEVCSAPRLDQAAAWLREVKGIDIEISAYQHLDGESIKHQYSFVVLTINGKTFANTWYNNYEQALSDAVDLALELLGKEENNGM